ncbi:zinc-binding loop region of homing endonuclease, partial [Paecilomyces variotii]
WLTSDNRAHEYGYTKVNLRNIYYPDNRTEKINVQPFRYQLAVVASGYGQNLLLTSDQNATHEMSHLCHNHGCFNPHHVCVEPLEINRKRGGCVG